MTPTWVDAADRVLAELFVPGQPQPAIEALRDAYPFGERSMHPYKVWLKRVKAWRAAHSLGLARPKPAPRQRVMSRDPGQTSLLDTLSRGGR